MNHDNGRVRVLFVCMGNICRSPAAHGVMERLVEQRGLGHAVEIDSAGTLDYHEGELPDGRMRQAASSRGYNLTHRSRPIRSSDFHSFDYIVAMDRVNLSDMQPFTPKPPFKAEVSLLMEHHPDPPTEEVPDPYSHGASMFDHVMDLVEVACAALLDKIVARHHLA